MTSHSKYGARLQIIMDEYADEIAKPLRDELAHERSFALSAQAHASQLEVELKKRESELKKKTDLVWTMVEYMTLRDELKDFECRMLQRLKDSL